MKGNPHTPPLLCTDAMGNSLFGLDAYGFFSQRPATYFASTPPEYTGRAYLFGNGHRAYIPGLRRFAQADTFSPFAAGGLNSYAYCLSDPVNRQDLSGHASIFSRLAKLFRRGAKKPRAANSGRALDAMSDPIAGAPALANLRQGELPYEMGLYGKASDVYGKISRSGEPGFVDRLVKGRPYKFVMTRDGTLSVSPWVRETGTPSHPVVAFHGTAPGDRTPDIIAAGNLIKRSRKAVALGNWSGHYRPPFQSLDSPAHYFTRQGLQVERVAYPARIF
ncbi:RHS repeat-associated core domain-containing protein [Pseudomonas typographi]|uniref:RHS repeat-associated core domain-containing protein n=1 Tax=Pseudomonas typographi TaxID=2715964 RepID=A0ABR7Z4Y6_9PSED|nr:RHS repeat-associated core domain-containing protein [Pseudomonas typographi]MBD1600442.1 RHS repeat-associated core domain-containing protein [Pseudomonas typographi]